MDASARFAFPLLHAGQAQKEMFHNEAVVRIDALLHAAVIATGIDAPPPEPEPGQAWIVGDAATGDWSGRADQIAAWTEGGWRFAVPRDGMELWVESLAQPARYRAGAGWQAGVTVASRIEIDGVQVVGGQAAAIVAPAGGATVDDQARAAIAAVLDALRAHGLIASEEL